MSNAEVALRAAKDLNADSLVPEVYRSAVDTFFKAKRDFRLKNFETARQHALKATRLAEQAEFEAYRLGGATPEASSKLSAPEGGSPDAESAFKKPDGPTGPKKQKFTTTFPTDGVPTIGSVPPVTGPVGITGGLEGLGSTDVNPNDDITLDDIRRYDKAAPQNNGGPLQPLELKSIPEFYDDRKSKPSEPTPSKSEGEIPSLGTGGNIEAEGLDHVEFQDVKDAGEPSSTRANKEGY